LKQTADRRRSQRIGAGGGFAFQEASEIVEVGVVLSGGFPPLGA
jgi:hypothetical protein